VLQAFVITLREGLEAFLIVAISLAYLRKAGRAQLTRYVHWGLATGIGLSAAGGLVLYRTANQEILEGPLAILAAVSVLWLTAHMWRAGRNMKADIEDRLQSSSGRAGVAAAIGVFSFTLLMISREGMETALLLLQLRETMHLALGAVAGVTGAAGVAWLWSRYGHRINLALFFQVTAIFLFVFVVQLFIAGIHESAEVGYLPYSAAIHAATESWGPDSLFGHLLTYLMVILPLAWLALQAAISKRPVFTSSSSSPAAPLPHGSLTHEA